MSTDHDAPRDPPNHGDTSTQPRRPSTGSQKSKALGQGKVLKSSDSLAGMQVKEAHDASVASEANSVKLDELLRHGEAVKNSPDDAREWLRSFGLLRKDSDVSTRLRDLGSKEGQIPVSPTFLRVLSQWISLWFAKVERARKEHKTSRGGSSNEQSDLDWLFQFTQDYLRLGHVGFPAEDLTVLLENLINVCLKTNKQSDINNALDILNIILRYYELPKELLEPTLVVLSASLANLAETPKHLHSCFALLATGSIGQDTVNILFDFIRTPTVQNNMKNLSHARGATRLFRSVIATRRRTGEYVVDLGQLASTICDAAKQRIFRFAVDILQCWHAILSAEDRKAEILLLDFEQITAALQLCLTAQPPSSNGIVGLPALSFSNALPEEESEHRQYERHFRDRDVSARSLGDDLESLWPFINQKQQQSVNEYVLSFPQYATSAQLLRCIDYIATMKPVLPTSQGWEVCLDKILQGVVQDQSIDTRCRVEMIKVLDKVALPMADTTEYQEKCEVLQNSGTAGNFLSRLGQTYLKQASVENDRMVVEVLMSSLQHLITLTEYPSNASLQAPTIIHKLRELVMMEGDMSDLDDERASHATKALANILMGSLYIREELTSLAYEAVLDAASLQCKSRRSRIEAMRVLYRIRVDSHGYVYFQTVPDSEYIATALCRTRSSAEAFNYELPSAQRHSASSSSLSTKSSSYEPLWMYDELIMPDIKPSASPRKISVDSAYEDGNKRESSLDITSWLLHVIRCIQSDTDWETYSFTLIHLGSQLSNIRLFSSSLYTIVKLRQIVCDQVVNASFREPPASTGLKKSDVALCFFNVLAQLIPYATIRREPIQKGFGDDLVRAFLTGIAGIYEGTSRGCIHALSICSLEIPSSVASHYPSIVDKLSKNMTQSHLTIYILEFLSQVASLPEVHSNFNQDEITIIFGVCIQFLEKVREQNHVSQPAPTPRLGTSARQSGVNLKRPPYRAAMLKDVGLPQYAAALAYHTMIFWFLSLKLEIRAKYVSWIVPRLVWKNARGEETIDEQSQAFIDMMQRTAFSDLGETLSNPQFAKSSDGPVISASWVVGLSIVTAETAGHTGLTQITKRQASGTTYAIYQQLTTQLPSHHAPSYTEIREHVNDSATIEMLPPHILLQMVSTAAPTSTADQSVPLPKEDYVTRALDIFDRIPTVDSHKVGVLFIGEGQADESQFLLNEGGTPDYDRFLHGLGYVVSLEPPLRFNPQGLQHPRDGNSTIAWRDRITEIVFQIPTMMPNDLEEDSSYITKKSHVGNCFVNVIFNRSRQLWKFENFKSQFNYVNIVITPASRCSSSATSGELNPLRSEEKGSASSLLGMQEPAMSEMPDFYKVHVLTKDDLANISPAADPKIISAAQLPKFVRVLALNANVFCQAWNSKDYDKEFASAWRARLQQIKILKERAISKSGRQDMGLNTASASIPTAAGRRTPVPRDDMPGGRDGALAMQLDFGKWTLEGR